MAKSKHMRVRMGQRGIDKELVDVVARFGETQEAGNAYRVILGRKGLDLAISRLDTLRKGLLRARDKGGIVLVEGSDGTQITTYTLH
jgi:hypothetical protein